MRNFFYLDAHHVKSGSAKFEIQNIKYINSRILEFSRTVDVKLLENTLSFDKFEKYKTVFSKSREVPEKFREQTLRTSNF